MFFAFGALFFWTLPSSFVTLGHSRSPYLIEVIGAFAAHCAFAANVFFVFLALHCVQWLASRRLLKSCHHLPDEFA